MFKIADANNTITQKLISLVAAVITIAVCILPMGSHPKWNGEFPEHRNQYELITEAFLEGRLHFAYGDEANLDALTNPYDPEERKATDVEFHWDHAYYDGQYYMYFGVVPVFLAFLPYRLITGSPLTSYHATQLFTAVFIAGIFSLFWLLKKLFFRKLPFGLYLCLSIAFSVMSVWYASAEPALYCTAITAAIALEVWSIFLFVQAVYLEKKENRQILLAAAGALLGALVFGCRPPIALANIVVIPLLYLFIKDHKLTPKLLGKLFLAALPYLVVAVCLMLYNYARFDDPFEFGQVYQLTEADQTNYSFALDGWQLYRLAADTKHVFFSVNPVSDTFPFFQTSGILVNFPILWFCALLLVPSVFRYAKQTKLFPLLFGLYIAVLAIDIIDILWAPIPLPRYHMDMYFLLGTGCFLTLGMWYEISSKKKLLTALIPSLSLVTAVFSYFFYAWTL